MSSSSRASQPQPQKPQKARGGQPGNKGYSGARGAVNDHKGVNQRNAERDFAVLHDNPELTQEQWDALVDSGWTP